MTIKKMQLINYPNSYNIVAGLIETAVMPPLILSEMFWNFFPINHCDNDENQIEKGNKDVSTSYLSFSIFLWSIHVSLLFAYCFQFVLHWFYTINHNYEIKILHCHI